MVVDDTRRSSAGIDFTALRATGTTRRRTRPAPRSAGTTRRSACAVRPSPTSPTHFTRRWNEVTGEQLAAAGRSRRRRATWTSRSCAPSRRRRTGFAPRGEFTILEAYLRALRSAERFIYLENQFLWSPEVVDVLADKLARPAVRRLPDPARAPGQARNGADTTRGQLGRLLDADAGAGRLLATTITAHHDGRSAPVYVHAKVAVVDDRWLTIGSANLNEHSLFNDTEMNVLVCDPALARRHGCGCGPSTPSAR